MGHLVRKVCPELGRPRAQFKGSQGCAEAAPSKVQLGLDGFLLGSFGIRSGFRAFLLGDGSFPKGPCTQTVYSLGPMYLCREYCIAKVYTIWKH